MTLVCAFALSACVQGAEVETIRGSKAYLAEPVAVDIVEAYFNILFLLPQIDSVQQSLRDGACVAFRFVKRIKDVTGCDRDFQDSDTFVAGFICDADGEKFVELFGFTSPQDKARVDQRNSI